MRGGHADAQYMFREMGKALGFEVRKTWTPELPTDGVWLLPGSDLLLPRAPAVAIEVAVSEGSKALKGSLDTLAEVSPALGLLVINEVEIRRGKTRDGDDEARIERRLQQRFAAARDRTVRYQQRLEVWSYDQLRQKYRLATGVSTPETLARLAGHQQ